MADTLRLLYLIGQFPAINHSYLLAEIKHLRRLGFHVAVASVSPPDRPSQQLHPDEREEAERTYYLKSVPILKAAISNLNELFLHPLRYFRGLMFALRLGRGNLQRTAYHLAYFAEAILVGRYMRQSRIPHVHASFSATVSLLVSKTFPVSMSFAVYGFGELHDPSTTHLEERINGALFVRSISRHGRGQMMLCTDRSEWGKLVYVPLGIDPGEFAPRRATPTSVQTNVLCVGRLSPEKGQAILLEAISALTAEGVAVHLTLVGDGPDRQWLQSRAAELNIGADVQLTGWVDQDRLMRLYAETDMFVLPSLAEGIPMVLMEAMAMEIPCVAPCITGIPELIENGVDGMLFSVADVSDMSAKIRTLAQAPELRRQIGARGRARVLRDYDMARNTERFSVVLLEQLGQPSKRDR